jgi:multiple sugar transport system ATP-binding protein
MGALTLSNVTKKFGTVDVIKGVDLTVEPGEFCVFVGPSGCGKSTLLRIIAGLEDATGGEIAIAGTRVNDVAPAKREIAMVFQSLRALPASDRARQHGVSALKQAGVPKPEIAAATDKAAGMLSLGALLDRRPSELSGGQRQSGRHRPRHRARRRSCFCSMNPCPIWTRPCASPRESKSPACTANWAPRWSMSPTTRWRP